MTVTLDHSSLQQWRRKPVKFIEQVLCDPESETQRPFKLLAAERTFLAHAFKVGADGRLLYPEQVYSCPKKSGKTTFAALHTLLMIILFGGSYPEATLCANDEEQARGRVFEMCKRIVECSPLLRVEANITQGKIEFPALHATIQAISSDYAGAAGGNQNVAVFDELWAYTSERCRRLWDELVPPPTRKIACRLTVTYAGYSGESTLLEELYARGLQQPLVGQDLHAGDGLLMFWSHVPIAWWQTEQWLAEMRRTSRPNAYLRMIENRWVTTESTFIDLAWYDDCVDPAAHPMTTAQSLEVWVGVDASVKHDSTGIVAVGWDKKVGLARLVWHRIFQPSASNPLDFEQTIEKTLLDLHKRFRVRKVYYDPYQMHATAQRLTTAGVAMEEFPQSSPNLTEASQNLFELFKGRNIVVYPDAEIRLAISRAIAIETSRGWRIAKDKQHHKIDVVIALGMACLAALKGQTESSYDYSGDWINGPSTGDKSEEEARNRKWREAQFRTYCASGGRIR